MCQPYWLLGHTSNNLPLRLKLINHKSKSHLLKVDFHFRLAQLLCQWIYYVVYGVYSSYLDIFLFEIVAYTTTLCAWTSDETFGSLARTMVLLSLQYYVMASNGMISSSTINIRARIHPIHLQHTQPSLID